MVKEKIHRGKAKQSAINELWKEHEKKEKEKQRKIKRFKAYKILD